MNASELDEIFARLLDLLENVGLSWIAAQVNEEIVSGRLVTRVPVATRRGWESQNETIEIYENMSFDQSQPLSRGAAIATEPYNAQERLQALIRALRRAIADSTAIEQYVSDFLRRALPLNETQLFSTEDTSPDRVLLASANYQIPESRNRTLRLLDQLADRVVADG